MDPWIPVIVAVVSAVAALGSVVVQSRRDRKSVDATAAEAITEAAKRAVELLQASNDRELDYYRRGCRRLIAQIESAGLTPVWVPEDGKG